MAMTKRYKVTFEITAKLTTKEVDEFTKGLIETSRKIVEGKPVNPELRACVMAALEGGVEAAVECAYRRGVRELIRDAYNEMCSEERAVTKFAPATVEVLK